LKRLTKVEKKLLRIRKMKEDAPLKKLLAKTRKFKAK
jgi:hypothetical protein